MWLTQAVHDILVFGFGLFSGAFLAWQIWLFHEKEMARFDDEMRRLSSRREMGVDRAAKRRDAPEAREGHETLERWRWN